MGIPPVDDERERPFDDVVEGEGLQAGVGCLGGLGVDDRLLLLGLDSQHPQQLGDHVVGHQLDLHGGHDTGERGWRFRRPGMLNTVVVKVGVRV